MKFILELFKGMVIGLANIIPGVSGGTMMVSMGIYDTLIHCITHLFKEFKKSIKTLLPYLLGMVVAIGALSFALKWAFGNYPLPTNTLFIGLILGGLPAILRQVKGKKKGATGAVLFVAFFALIILLQVFQRENVATIQLSVLEVIKLFQVKGKKKGATGAVLFVAFFALIILLQVFQRENVATIQLSVLEVIKLFLLGALASATMVIPGVSGSMILKLLGYYEPVVTVAIPSLISGFAHGDWAAVGANLGILAPFGLGVVVGIFVIAKVIELLLARWEGPTYCAILGLVTASPVAILIATNLGNLSWGTLIVSLLTFALGFYVAWRLGGREEKPAAV